MILPPMSHILCCCAQLIIAESNLQTDQKMKIVLFIVPALMGVVALGQRTDIPEICNPEVPSCVTEDDRPQECPTCCCTSSENVEFYNANSQLECNAPPAIYKITFYYTASEECQQDDIESWSRPSVVSHGTGYRVWDACMDDVTVGVATFSQSGNLTQILAEGVTQAVTTMNVLDAPIFDGDSISTGSGETSIYLTFDKDHPYVSSLTRLEPSPDYVVGVADLFLCDGAEWKESVKICFELFSTATESERVAPKMMRNSVQGNNCSYGYANFTLIKTEDFNPRTTLEDTCYPQIPDECPQDPIEECSTCCCESSDNIELYDPDSPEPECTASPATYEMTFNFNWNEACHPGNFQSYSIFQPVWSWPIGVSHNIEYRMWDACMDDVSVGVGLVSQFGLPGVIVQEFVAAGDNILDYAIGDMLQPPTSQFSQNIMVDSDHQWVSALSNRGPTPDQVVGVADLRLCDGDEWKESVKVCFELFSTAAASERVAPDMMRNSVQNNNCSFGYIEFKMIQETESSATIITGAVAVVYAALGVFVVF